MGCADAGHILLSKHVAEDLAPFPWWNPHLHDLGECEVKHGRRISLVNFYTDEVGNPSVPRKLQQMQVQPAEAQRNNLPAQLSSFIGRGKGDGGTQRLLADSRGLTLTGVGGGGKTRLALEVAADLISELSGWCVVAVELAAASDPNMVTHLTAEALGIREQPKTAAGCWGTLVDRLRSKRLLLVLDSCEHLLDACAKLVGALLKTCGKLRILATSREAIGVAGEKICAGAIPYEAGARATMSLESLCQFEAVRLFRERAVAVQPLSGTRRRPLLPWRESVRGWRGFRWPLSWRGRAHPRVERGADRRALAGQFSVAVARRADGDATPTDAASHHSVELCAVDQRGAGTCFSGLRYSRADLI